MRLPSLPRSTKRTLVAVAISALAGILPLLSRADAQAQPAAQPFLTCDALIQYVPASGTTETYQQTFRVAPGHPFVDDFSTTTRQHLFTATALPKASGMVVEFNYFSDVSALNAVDLTTELALDRGQKFERLSGSQKFYTSYPTSYSLSWTVTARH